MVAAWIKLYGKFLRHIRAVEIGHPQPGAHPSMFPSFQEEGVKDLYMQEAARNLCVLEGIVILLSETP